MHVSSSCCLIGVPVWKGMGWDGVYVTFQSKVPAFQQMCLMLNPELQDWGCIQCDSNMLFVFLALKPIDKKQFGPYSCSQVLFQAVICQISSHYFSGRRGQSQRQDCRAQGPEGCCSWCSCFGCWGPIFVRTFQLSLDLFKYIQYFNISEISRR